MRHTGTRRGKRGRSDSEEKPEGSKRQRTASASPSPNPNERFTSQTADSDDGMNGRNNGSRKSRGAAARNNREKEIREEKERSRLEAANKRKGRAERRRAEDSDAADELPLAARSATNKTAETPVPPPEPPSSVAAVPPDTPPSLQTPVASSHKKGGRPPNSRKGKQGKNQYTKDRDLADGSDRSPNRSQSRDLARTDETTHASGNRSSNTEGRTGKSKSSNISKITMGDMKKRVAAMLDFISRTQLEMAGDSMSPTNGDLVEKTIRVMAESLPVVKVIGESGEPTNDGESQDSNASKDFKDLSCLEMMDVLTRQLVKWQKEFI
ncbi:hypothetical protein DH86_00002908 [Scytalidium sp. 3C]|nr:hypothetical protein DH86_00002908 [Scytalidium sp. 3C]